MTNKVLDCRGQRCPLPELPVGATIRVLADDPAAAIDIPAWCRLRNQDFIGSSTVDNSAAYDIRRTS
jgi:tRNA 2-thiouridine synthesizing protein A